MIPFKSYFFLLTEDYTTSVNQAKNILKNNEFKDSDISQVIKSLENIYKNVRFEDREHSVSNVDSNIPALVYWWLGGVELDIIKAEYNKYCNTKSLYSKNYLTNWANTIKQEIIKNKWFKPSVEKTNFLKEKAIEAIEEIHRQYVPKVDEPDEDATNTDLSQDIVYQDDKIVIYLADSMSKCIQHGENTNLCIAYKPKDNYYWRYRMGEMKGVGMTTYYVFYKTHPTVPFVVIDALGNDDGPTNEYGYTPVDIKTGKQKPDEYHVSDEKVISVFPMLKIPFEQNVFQFIPYGENEIRIMEIQEYESILDPNLKTLEDYDIYVQLADGISDYEWEVLDLPLKYKQILFKKYLGTGAVVGVESFEKYGNKKDLPWYEDIISRKRKRSIKYALLRGIENIQNQTILNHYYMEFDKMSNLKAKIIQDIKNGASFIDLSDSKLFFLPDLSDIEFEGGFDCSYNRLQSLQGAPQKVGGNFDCSDNQLQSLQGAPQKVGGYFNCSYNQLQSLQGAPQKVGGYFNCNNNKQQFGKDVPSIINDYDTLDEMRWFSDRLKEEIQNELNDDFENLKENSTNKFDNYYYNLMENYYN